MKRVVESEFLDTLPPDDPRALRSRRDLRRVNSWMGNVAIIAKVLQQNFPGVPKQITELGAGDGNFLLRVARKMAPQWLDVTATLLDCKESVSAETLVAFAKFGWHSKFVVADVFDWAQTQNSCEIVVANLFLHHFEDARLTELLRAVSRRATLFIAVEPHRFRFAFPCAQMLRLIGCSKITRHDAAASIRAGFVRKEISALWPDNKSWRLTERRAGLFSHLFVAQKIS
ncbi:MAG: methyltransferase domain-containing protein [Verrucomicrobiota bacterium]